MTTQMKLAKNWTADSQGLPLYRGFREKNAVAMMKIQSPTDRHPMHMPHDVQSRIDNWFEVRFGVRFRQRSLFATGDITIAKAYSEDSGEVRHLRVAADYFFCWSPFSEDLFQEWQMSPVAESVEQMLERLQFQCDGLADAIKSRHEIMLVCPAIEAYRLDLNET